MLTPGSTIVPEIRARLKRVKNPPRRKGQRKQTMVQFTKLERRLHVHRPGRKRWAQYTSVVNRTTPSPPRHSSASCYQSHSMISYNPTHGCRTTEPPRKPTHRIVVIEKGMVRPTSGFTGKVDV